MVIAVIGLEDFIKPFKQECPEPIERAIITDEIRCVDCIMVIRSDYIQAVVLQVKDLNTTYHGCMMDNIHL